MKTLTGIRLINWHYFTDQTIMLNGNTLITGANGAGKSTILDALQIVLIANLTEVRFNVSAYSETRRDLLGYVRGKTGEENSQGGFLRSGDFSSHVALELADTTTNNTFILGVVVDVFKDGSYSHAFYKWENTRLTDNLLVTVTGNKEFPHNLKKMKDLARIHQGLKVYSNVQSYREDLLQKLGILPERFFSLLVKGIGFSPIVELRKFVYDYILQEKDIDITDMRENYQHYRKMEDLVEEILKKISNLTIIKDQHQEIQRLTEVVIEQDYLIRLGSLEHLAQKLQQTRSEDKKTASKLNETKTAIKTLENKLQTLTEEQKSLTGALLSNTVYQELEKLKTELNRLTQNKKTLNEELETLGKDLGLTLEFLDNLVKEKLFNNTMDWTTLKNLHHAIYSDTEKIPEKEELEKYKTQLNQVSQFFNQELWNLENQLKDLDEQITKLKENIKQLEKGKLQYKPEVNQLKQLLEQRLTEPVQILCEQLEIPDEKWQNAVEGYLNTRRFDLLVGPEYFDKALKIYKEVRQQYRIHGVGLINTEKSLTYIDRCDQGSLAEEITTDNPYARGYINLLLGNLMKAQTEEELKRFTRAITPHCMTYINHAARQINTDIYAQPFIGQRALPRQLAIRKQQLLELEEKRQIISHRHLTLKNILAKDYSQRINLISIHQKLEKRIELSQTIDRTKAKLAQLDDTTIIDLQMRLETIDKAIADSQQEKEQSIKHLGGLEEKIEQLKKSQKNISFEITRANKDLKDFRNQYPKAFPLALRRYLKERKTTNPERIAINFRTNQEGQKTQREKVQSKLNSLQTNYNITFQFGGSPTIQGVSQYLEELMRLEQSELPNYQEKVSLARKDAEQEFKEHFISQLREQIEMARDEFTRLNDALKDVQFGNDRYQFLITAEPGKRKYYDMLMDDYILYGSDSIFGNYFQEKHSEALDELFRELLSTDSSRIEEFTKNIADYRNYLDYDIKIFSPDNKETLYSKVSRLRSGGETQTPYYVAIIASFLQLYRVYQKENTIRLIIFDEAFNKMDGERIEAALEFIKQFDIQVLIAAPTDKIQSIGPHMDSILLVMRENNQAWVGNFRMLSDQEKGTLLEEAIIADART